MGQCWKHRAARGIGKMENKNKVLEEAHDDWEVQAEREVTENELG